MGSKCLICGRECTDKNCFTNTAGISVYICKRFHNTMSVEKTKLQKAEQRIKELEEEFRALCVDVRSLVDHEIGGSSPGHRWKDVRESLFWTEELLNKDQNNDTI